MSLQHGDLRPDVLTADDVVRLIPCLAKYPGLAAKLIRWLKIDRINEFHRQTFDTPGVECANRLLHDALKVQLRVDGADVLNRLPEGAFITVSNHPLGALDGIALIHLIGSRRPDFKVLVNMFLNHVGGLRPNFIAVDAWRSSEPSKRAVSVSGLRACLNQIHEGKPIGFFPAGAMSNLTWRLKLEDREWQNSVLRIIYNANVPVIPIYFHGKNSFLCNLMGRLCWPIRSVMLPGQVVRMVGRELRVTIGEPISVEEQAQHRESALTLGQYLRAKTYDLRH